MICHHTNVVWRYIMYKETGEMSLPHQAGIKFYRKFIFSSVHFLHLPNFVTTTGCHLKNSEPSKSSVSVLTLTIFCIYTRLQTHVSAAGGIRNYIHLGIQVDTGYLITYWNTYFLRLQKPFSRKKGAHAPQFLWHWFILILFNLPSKNFRVSAYL